MTNYNEIRSKLGDLTPDAEHPNPPFNQTAFYEDVQFQAVKDDVDLNLPLYGWHMIVFFGSGVAFFGIRIVLYVVFASIGAPSGLMSLAAVVALMVANRRSVTYGNIHLSQWGVTLAAGFLVSQFFSAAIIYGKPEMRKLIIQQQTEETAVEPAGESD